MKQKTRRYFGNGLKALALLPIYLGSLIGVQSVTFANSPKILNQSQLEQRLVEERKKLGNQIEENVLISARISYVDGEGTYARKIREKEYEIVLSEEFASTATLRHELAHIKNKDFDKIEKLGELGRNIYYLFWAEPKVTIDGLKK